MFCNKCGTQVNVGSEVCQNCGTPVTEMSQQGEGYPVEQKTSVAPMVLGIIGIVFALILPLVTYCCSIPGLVMSIKALNSGATTRKLNRNLNIIALCVAVVNSLAGVMMAVTAFL